MAFGWVVEGVYFVAVDGIDVLRRLIHVFGAGVAEAAGGFGVLEVGDLAGAQGEVVGGVIDHDVARGVAD